MKWMGHSKVEVQTLYYKSQVNYQLFWPLSEVEAAEPEKVPDHETSKLMPQKIIQTEHPC